jgi:hypothetical protein
MSRLIPRLTALILLSILFLGGCRIDPVKTAPDIDLSDIEKGSQRSDLEKVTKADYSILFVGNSHTTIHNIPGLVSQMIKFMDRKKEVYTYTLSVGFLRDALNNKYIPEEIDTRPWKFVVLQAQEISQSGKYNYSQKEGIDLAKRARAKNADVIYYAEWGIRGLAGHGERQENVYLTMAKASGARVAAVGRAWDLAMTQDPALMLHAGDNNHQNPRGAFLTACVLYSAITGKDPTPLAQFPYEHAYDHERKFLANTAAMVFAAEARKKK